MSSLLTQSIKAISGLNKITIDLTEDANQGCVNIVELPELITVETRFLSPQIAINAQIDTLHSLSEASEEEVTTLLKTPENNCADINNVLMSEGQSIKSTSTNPQKVDAFSMTDSENPKRDREQQTDNMQVATNDIAIQCNIKQDFLIKQEELLFANSVNEVARTSEDEKQEFIQYITGKTQSYRNGKLECLLCGEIKANTKSMYKHLSIHYGPSVLCFVCGLQFEHSSLFRSHRCEMLRKKRKPVAKRTRFISCPHYRCRVRTISLIELYDHINEHIGEHIYYCDSCKRGFCTAGEYRHHIPLRLKCLESAKRRPMPYARFNSKVQSTYRMRVFTLFTFKKKRIIVKNFLSQRERTKLSVTQRCQICLKNFGNEFKFGRHNRRCLSNHLRRLKRRRFPSSSVTNSHTTP